MRHAWRVCSDRERWKYPTILMALLGRIVFCSAHLSYISVTPKRAQRLCKKPCRNRRKALRSMAFFTRTLVIPTITSGSRWPCFLLRRQKCASKNYRTRDEDFEHVRQHGQRIRECVLQDVRRSDASHIVLSAEMLFEFFGRQLRKSENRGQDWRPCS